MSTRICYLAGREATYSRTHNMLVALRLAEFDVVTCFPPNKALRNYPKLLWQFMSRMRGCDLYVVGFYGQC